MTKRELHLKRQRDCMKRLKAERDGKSTSELPPRTRVRRFSSGMLGYDFEAWGGEPVHGDALERLGKI